MLKRWMALGLALLLCLALMPASGQGDSLPVMAGYEEQDSMRDWHTNLFFQRMVDITGQAFEYWQYKGLDSWQKAKAEMLQPGAELPDLLFKASLSPAETMEMLDKGVLIDLRPMLKEQAPHLYALLQENPDCLQMITLPDGRIGALPYLNLSPTQNTLWIHSGWLNTLKLTVPTTAEELEAVLRAFKQQDPNRNGKQDEVPLAFLGAYDLKYLAHAFGLVGNDYNVFARDGQVAFMPTQPAFREFIRWSRRLYQEGLLDQEGFATADSLRRVTDAKATVRYGAVFAPLPSNLVPAEWVPDYQALPPLRYEGRQVYRSVAPRAVPGTFAITSAAKDPAALLRWVDYLYSDPGAILAFAGLEGQDYLVDGDGTWRKTQAASQTSFLDEATVASGSSAPGVSQDAFQRLYGDPAVARISEEIDKVSAIVRDPFPPYSLRHAEEAEIDPLQRAIGRYVDESIARFILGEWPTTDEQFALFEAELDQLGLPSFIGFWQKVLDNMKEADIELP